MARKIAKTLEEMEATLKTLRDRRQSLDTEINTRLNESVEILQKAISEIPVFSGVQWKIRYGKLEIRIDPPDDHSEWHWAQLTVAVNEEKNLVFKQLEDRWMTAETMSKFAETAKRIESAKEAIVAAFAASRAHRDGGASRETSRELSAAIELCQKEVDRKKRSMERQASKEAMERLAKSYREHGAV